MHRTVCLALAAAAWGVFACGGEAQEHEPLISGTVTGEFEGASFTIEEGIAKDRSETNKLIVLGTDAINCGTPDQQDPPTGYFASIGLESFDVGTYSNVPIAVFENHGSFSGTGGNGGTVEISVSTTDVIAGTVAYSYTDSETGDSYRLDGTFEVLRCAE